MPELEVRNPLSVVMFGSYTLWRYARAKSLHPGVFRIAPFVHEKPWQQNGLTPTYIANGSSVPHSRRFSIDIQRPNQSF